MSALLSEALLLASRQHGAIARTQLDHLGFTEHQVARLVSTNVFVRVLGGAYRVASAPDDSLSRCAAVCLSRPGLVIAGPTAARLHELRRAPRDHRIHVIARPHAQPARAPWLVSYRTAMIASTSISTRADGIRLTTPARTVIDMTRFVGSHDLISMIEQGIDRGSFTSDAIRAVAEGIATPGRPFARQFIEVLDGRFPGGAAGSHWETRVASELEARGVRGLVRQHPLEVPGYGRLRFDLAVPVLRWAVEVDVHPSHTTREGAARDKFRDRCCANVGWQVHRVGEPDLDLHLDNTMGQLVASYRRRHRAPTT